MGGYGQVVRFPEIAGRDGDLLLRVWRRADAAAMVEAIRDSHAHLAPWMEFANQPLPSPAEQVGRFSAWQARRRAGGDAIYGMFVDERVAGGCGLHRRLGPDGLEIGYWVHVDYTRRGIASRAAALLTDTAFRADQITHVEIHHDAANRASEGVPRRLGFTLVGESPDEPTAPGECGIERRWRMLRGDWVTREDRAARS
jgi:ribosomal-protein-serine acetyltransferase